MAEPVFTPEQANQMAKTLVDMKKYFESKDVSTTLTKILETQNEILSRIKDVDNRMGGLDTTVRNFMTYQKAEVTNTGGQGKVTQPVSRGAQLTKQDLDSVEWQTNSRGEWAYSRNRDGSDSDNSIIQELVYRLLQKSPIILFDLEYSLSGKDGMFLGRVKPGSGKPSGRRNY